MEMHASSVPSMTNLFSCPRIRLEWQLSFLPQLPPRQRESWNWKKEIKDILPFTQHFSPSAHFHWIFLFQTTVVGAVGNTEKNGSIPALQEFVVSQKKIILWRSYIYLAFLHEIRNHAISWSLLGLEEDQDQSQHLFRLQTSPQHYPPHQPAFWLKPVCNERNLTDSLFKHFMLYLYLIDTTLSSDFLKLVWTLTWTRSVTTTSSVGLKQSLPSFESISPSAKWG